VTPRRAARLWGGFCLTAALALGGSPALADESTGPPSEPVPAHLAAEAVLPAKVDKLEVRARGGLWGTQLHVFTRELPWKEGDVVDLDAWNVGLRRLWNTQIFAQVRGWLERRDGTLVAVLDIEERWSLIPAFEFSHGGRATWFLAGLSEHNFAGRFVNIDAVYEYFDGVHGGNAIYRDQRFLDRRLELRAQAGRMMRPRPDFVVQRTIARVGLFSLERDDKLRWGGTLHAFDDGFLPSIEEGAVPGAWIPNNMQTLLFEPSIRVGRVDARRIQYNGVTFEVRPQVAATLAAKKAHAWGGFLAELLYYKMIGRFTLAARVRGAAQTKTPGAQLDFWLGGLDPIRGYRDNYVRTNVYLASTAEIRFVVFDFDLLACEAAAFADVSVSRSALGQRQGTFSVGPGIRFFIPKLVDSELRIDLPFAYLGNRFVADLSVATEPFF